MVTGETELEWAIIDSLLGVEPKTKFDWDTIGLKAGELRAIGIYFSPTGKQVNVLRFQDGWGVPDRRSDGWDNGYLIYYTFPELLARIQHPGWRKKGGFPPLEVEDNADER